MAEFKTIITNLEALKMGVAKKKCKCHGEFKLSESLIKTPKGLFCSYPLAIKWANEQTSKRVQRQIKKDKQSYNKETKRLKESIKPKSKWLSELQALVNKYVRLRDITEGCISCDKASNWSGQFHCGHYFSRGHSSSLRFNLWNMHKQCSVCNNHLSGNIGEYTPRLIEKIGVDRFDYLKSNKSNVASYDIEWVKRAIKICRVAIKRIEKNATRTRRLSG